MSSQVLVQAPSNIALIKYMGKENEAQNLPANGSLSMTLSDLRSEVDIRFEEATHFEFKVSDPGGSLPAAAIERYEKHAYRVSAAIVELYQARQSEFGIRPQSGIFAQIKSKNTFPMASGIASSASSFAALTLAVAASIADDVAVFRKIYDDPLSYGPGSLRAALAEIARQGSGSSCRSFEGPWIKWQGRSAQPISSHLPSMTDLVLVVSRGPKLVSSSAAHQRVKSSPLWEGRVARADLRLHAMRLAIAEGDLQKISKLSWAEMWDMHSLFHTSDQPFSFFEPGTVAAIQFLGAQLERTASGEHSPPIVTLDAGPNVHVIVPTREAEAWRDRLMTALTPFAPHLQILQDHEGQGAEIVSTDL